MTIHKIADIHFVTHHVQVSRDTITDRIYLFKHTDTRCDYASFDQQSDAEDYILTPFPTLQYTVNVEGDDPQQYS